MTSDQSSHHHHHHPLPPVLICTQWNSCREASPPSPPLSASLPAPLYGCGGAPNLAPSLVMRTMILGLFLYLEMLAGFCATSWSAAMTSGSWGETWNQQGGPLFIYSTGPKRAQDGVKQQAGNVLMQRLNKEYL